MSDFNNKNELLDWDDEIVNDGFPMLPDGEYDFTVVDFVRDRYAGNPEKNTRACHTAEITLRIASSEDNVDIKHKFFMLRKNEWQLGQFFCCIGQKKKNEPLRPNWNTLIGAKGRCKIGKRTYNGNEYNEVKKFLEPGSASTQTQTNFGEGGF